VILLSPFNHDHQSISVFLTSLISWHIQDHDQGEVPGPYQMRMRHSERGREPDVVFVSTGNLSRLQPSFVDGPVDLAVEIVSPDSVLRDRGEKYAESEMEGVPEYWVIDPIKQRADFFLLTADGRYERAKIDDNGVYRSKVLAGFWIKVDWLWRHPMPKIKDVLKEWERGF
jgi:Uma2 family endonuclease